VIEGRYTYHEMNTDYTLSEKEAYMAMYDFLSAIHARTKDEAIAIILSALQFRADGRTADPAYSADWKISVGRAKQGLVEMSLHF
jgi:hypothetical protein